MNHKLTTTVIADVILFTSFNTVFTDISTVALRALHRKILMAHTLIMQRQDTHMKYLEHLIKLTVLLTLAMYWVIQIGEWLAQQKAIVIKKYG